MPRPDGLHPDGLHGQNSAPVACSEAQLLPHFPAWGLCHFGRVQPNRLCSLTVRRRLRTVMKVG